jgi:predicted dehydrogenase
LNWDFWLGQAPKVEYVPQRCHFTFRWWYEYAGGRVTDWGAHHNDIAQWGMDMDDSGPIFVEADGDPPGIPNGYNTHPNFTIQYRYASGVTLRCMSGGENGILFQGDQGWIFVSRGALRGGPRPGVSDDRTIKEPLPRDAARLDRSTNHMGNFLESIRTRNRPICDVAVNHRSVSVCHLGNLSLRLGGRRLLWDPEAEQFIGDEEANSMLSRQMRPPWRLDA